MHRGTHPEAGGFTLIEVSIAMSIILVVALTGLGALVGSLSAVATATAQTRATQLANEVLEELETVPWNSLGFYAVDPRDTGSPPGYVPASEGHQTVTLPAATVLDQRVPLPLRTLTRGRTTFTVRTHIVHVPEGTDVRAFRRISAFVSWTSADGRPRAARVDRTRTGTSSARGFEAFLLRPLDVVVRDSGGSEKLDPFLLTWSRTVAPSGSQVLVRATTNLSAAAVSLSYPAVDPVTNGTVPMRPELLLPPAGLRPEHHPATGFDAATPVQAYVEETITVHSKVRVNAPAGATAPPRSPALRLYSATTQAIDWGPRSTFAAAVYAPRAESGEKSGATVEIYGGLVCGTFDTRGGWKLHYDLALQRLTANSYSLASWQEG